MGEKKKKKKEKIEIFFIFQSRFYTLSDLKRPKLVMPSVISGGVFKSSCDMVWQTNQLIL